MGFKNHSSFLLKFTLFLYICQPSVCISCYTMFPSWIFSNCLYCCESFFNPAIKKSNLHFFIKILLYHFSNKFDRTYDPLSERGCALSYTLNKCSIPRCVYRSVVPIRLCPSISCTLLRSAPAESRWVAKECLKPCGDIIF